MIIRKRAECWIVQDNKIYVGIKDGKISLPGGTLEKDETPIIAAIRETKEEIGVSVENLKLICKDLIIKNTWGGWTHAQTYSYTADFVKIDNTLLGNGPEGSFHRAQISIDKLEKYYNTMLNREDYFKQIAEQNLWIIKFLKSKL